MLAAAAEVSRRIAAPGFLEGVRASSRALREAASCGPVATVRGAGLLLGLVLEPVESGPVAAQVQRGLLEQDVLVGLSSDPNVLRLMPPLTLPIEAAERLRTALLALEALSGQGVNT